MPMILEVIISVLACSRIGAVHTIVVCYHSHMHAVYMYLI
jgi:acyl-coenzyme A synthetase/AMP-(fatty) acid ligase